jgi:signal transduction histidine kinase
MRGPDALGTGQRGGQSILPSAGMGTGIEPGAQAASAQEASAATGGGTGGPGTTPRRPAARPARLSLSNWPVSARLVAVFAVASVTGLVFGGLRVADAVSAADGYGRTAQLATLGEQSIRLAQALEDERDKTSGVAAYGTLNSSASKADPSVARPIAAALATETAEMNAAYKVTDDVAARVRALANAVGPAFPASLQSKAGAVVTSVDSISGLRSELIGQPAVQVIANYNDPISNLFVLDDEITSGSGDAVLADDVRALDALSRAKDQASQQRAVLYSILLQVSVNDASSKKTKAHPVSVPFNDIGTDQALNSSGGLGALTTAEGLQQADLTAFNDAATAAQTTTFLTTVVGQQDNEAQLLEGFVTLTGQPVLTFQESGTETTLGFDRATVADTWYSDMTALIGQMSQVESQVANAATTRSQSLQHQAMNTAVISAAVTAGAVLLVLLATALVGRTLVNPLRRLQRDALEIATVRLPERVAAAATGTDAEATAAVEPIGVQSTDEIGRVARAFDQVHAEAVRLAGNEAQLRSSLNTMFISLSRRSVPLIDRLARMIDSMEQNEDDPDQLGNLFAMDHLVTRMRRNSENLLVLAGEEPVRKWTEPVPLTDVARAAAAEIEQYHRVALAVQPGIMVSGQAAADVVHLLAELIENATLFSPRETQVRVTVMELGTGGAMIEVRDDGVGVSPSRLTEMNWRLDHPPVVDVSISRHMGLFAVARLAARHRIRVRLRPGEPQGLSALVWLPGSLTKRETGPVTGGFRSWSSGADTTTPPPTSFQPMTLARRGVGRHRSGAISSSGEQVAVRRTTQPAGSAASATAWFAAKRPSAGTARSQEELAAAWQTTGNGYGHGSGDADRVPEQGEWTATGLPRRVPGAAARPGTDTPGSGLAAAFAGAGTPAGGMPVLGAPAFREPARQDTAFQEQEASRRRSPEAARSRLSGFQLGSRDAVQAGRGPGGTPHAGEENSR